MPVAGGSTTASLKYHYEDHDTDLVNQVPPVQNTWYEAFDAYDVRLIWCSVYQTNDESAAKDVEIRWTIDGTVYFGNVSLPDADLYYAYRNEFPSAGGTGGLYITTDRYNAAWMVDKRGKRFKVEVRMTSVPGTNQTLVLRPVRETLEET